MCVCVWCIRGRYIATLLCTVWIIIICYDMKGLCALNWSIFEDSWCCIYISICHFEVHNFINSVKYVFIPFEGYLRVSVMSFISLGSSSISQ